MKQMLIAGTSSGVGKTTITLGIIQAMINRGLTVQPFKVGPDYIDTGFHTRISGRFSKNLDEYLIPETSTLKELYTQSLEGSDIAVIEGVMGMFDGLGKDHLYCSSAGIAEKLNIPVLLIVDGKASSTSVAAIVKGFLEFDSTLDIIGVIINRVSSKTHYELIKKAIEHYTSAEVFGYLSKGIDFTIPSRHLGDEIEQLELEINGLASELEKTVDLDRVIEKLDNISSQDGKNSQHLIQNYAHKYFDTKKYIGLRLAYAKDEAFSFYYQDNLSLIEKLGVKLIPFSPLNDKKLPEADGYYFGGGYPELFVDKLSANKSILKDIFSKYQNFAPIYAECGGLMYLSDALYVGDKTYPMVGIFSGYSYMTKSLRRFGYCEMRLKKDCLIGKYDDQIRGHEFHHSDFSSNLEPIGAIQKTRDGEVVKTWTGGYSSKNCFASYLHTHFYQHPSILTNLLDHIYEYRKRKNNEKH